MKNERSAAPTGHVDRAATRPRCWVQPCRIALLALPSLLASLGGHGTAQAECVADGNNAYTCAGDLTQVRANASDSFPPNTAQRVTVEDLTANIVNSIFYSSLGNLDQPVDLALATGAFQVSGTAATSVVLLESTGYAGANRGKNTTGTINGGTSAPGGPATFTLSGTVVGSKAFTGPAISMLAMAGDGGNGAAMTSAFLPSKGGDGGSVPTAGDVTLSVAGDSIVKSPGGAGVSMASVGGNGGNGGEALYADGGSGAGGGAAGTAGIDGDGLLTVTTSGASDAPALVLFSQGGQGGNGGKGESFGDGGDGGDGGIGSLVSIDAAISATTEGSNSDAIVATSIGGVGGNGGDGGWFAGGSPGGNSGLAGDVGVTITEGSVLTSGVDSAGIVAQSIGGRAGAAGTIAFSAVEFAASGGSAGSGGAVTVRNATAGAAPITTTGNQSSGIVAQSIGGAGGHGGNGIGAFYAGGNEGSYGGAGGAVIVDNGAEGAITTSGNDASGIVAQSIGGTGGSGGTSGSIAAFGGNAGSGGSGGGVTVTNAATIRTGVGPSGDAASDAVCQEGCSLGILAQSIGGGGGNGGAANGWFSVGGAAAGGGSGQTVTVTDTGDITASLADSPAITAQSIGGGGGHARAATAAGLIVTSAVGGTGGKGGDGGKVTINGEGIAPSDIKTIGDGSQGILAQSIGGGGGQASYAASGALSGENLPALSFAVGASGGAGGTGGAVTAFTNGSITTEGDDSGAVVAQSIGGGGGGAAYALAISVNGLLNLSSSTGGNGGSGGSGNNAEITSAAAIGTSGDRSAGLTAQSIGGGGGLAGLHLSPAQISGQVSLGLNIGAIGSGGGGLVASVETKADVQTSGDDSAGVIVQSIGGGGGVTTVAAPTNDTTVTIAVGGQEGATGGGGDTTAQIDEAATVSTGGPDSLGVIAQSIGGGGGYAIGAAGVPGTVSVGGESSGNGGTVTVNGYGTVSTGGDGGSHGIVAQSIGGGGGYAGTFSAEGADFGSGLHMSQDNQTSGDGGGVTVTVSGSVATKGESGFGVLAQSVGGGGGVAGYAGSTAKGALVGSSGGSGTAGLVTVTVDQGAGGVSTSGASAHGIVAQSAGGSGTGTTTGTKVSVTAKADVTATGAGAFGIYAQSTGDGRGVVALTVGEGATVQGGATGGAAAGVGVVVADGTANTVDNEGTITNLTGADGIAISYSGNGSLVVTNNGAIVGQVIDAAVTAAPGTAAAGAGGDSAITLSSGPGGTVATDGLLDARRFVNRGLLTVAGERSVGGTRITGDYRQTGTGVLAVDLDPGARRSDRLDVAGSAELDGLVDVTLTDVDRPPALGRWQRTILTSDAGLTLRDGFTVAASAAGQYRLNAGEAGTVDLSYDIDFANDTIREAVNGNQRALTDNIQSLYAAGALDGDFMRDLLSFRDAGSYAGGVNDLGAEVALDNLLAAVPAARAFNDGLLSCGDVAGAGGAVRFYDDGQCSYLRITAAGFDRDTTADNLGFSGSSWSLTGGGQVAVGGDWLVGGAFAYEKRQFDVTSSSASSDVDQFWAGASVKRRFDALELSAALSLGYGDVEIDRDWLGTPVRADYGQWSTSGQVRAAYILGSDRAYVMPRIGLAFDHFASASFTEGGDTFARLDVNTDAATFVSLRPAVEFGGEIVRENGTRLRPHLTLGATQYLNDPAVSLGAHFANAPDNTPDFTARTSLDETVFDASAGLDVLTAANMTVRAEAFLSTSSNSEGYGGSLTIEIPLWR
ncbi:autotransporter outer membrane beta-barrel domain-containing protein [Amaricoccus solimangrovi]|uniref:Autotransporter outer membrane beta-barrel domain-containing protein n=1 Tax=Amaricoccus solimangrovi TaxID=2589815 RepID=A0A501WAX8_9RHOB|nr:autotransporter outer membrane beta-barrel domain-containing protein [Amaricoccus solimangrovi]TPE45655.1 autotransporter outer membrane beta-barrel domain-containing protein [Amaricoccus solimangrovi]